MAANHQFSCTLDEFSDGPALLDRVASQDYDAIFLDIFMEGLNGIDVARSLPSRFHGFLVFTTTSPDFALDAIGLDAVHYLLKPVTMDHLEEVYARWSERSRKKQTSVLEITVDRQHLILDQEAIHYIDANNKSSIIHANDGVYKTYETMAALRDRLNEGIFIFPQRSFIVNMDYIDRFQKTRLILKDGTKLNVGRAIRDAIADKYIHAVKCF